MSDDNMVKFQLREVAHEIIR